MWRHYVGHAPPLEDWSKGDERADVHRVKVHDIWLPTEKLIHEHSRRIRPSAPQQPAAGWGNSVNLGAGHGQRTLCGQREQRYLSSQGSLVPRHMVDSLFDSVRAIGVAAPEEDVSYAHAFFPQRMPSSANDSAEMKLMPIMAAMAPASPAA